MFSIICIVIDMYMIILYICCGSDPRGEDKSLGTLSQGNGAAVTRTFFANSNEKNGEIKHEMEELPWQKMVQTVADLAPVQAGSRKL